MEKSQESETDYVQQKDDPLEDDGNIAADTKTKTNGHKKLTPIDLNYEPQRKIPKYSINSVGKVSSLKMNSLYGREDFMKMFLEKWSSEDLENYKDTETVAEIMAEPYKICLLPNLLENADFLCSQLVQEMIHDVEWSRKQMDLYEFYQSTDLSNMPENSLLSKFLGLLRQDVRPWLEKVTGIKLDYVSASCSMYTTGDYLLVHDDLLKDRQIAFIYYLTPWENVQEWSPEMGGFLEIFNSNEECLPQFPVERKISPKNNQLAFFKVGSRSFHQVGEVTNFDYPRLTINGWFHGASNDDRITDNLRIATNLNFSDPHEKTVDLKELINPLYLEPQTKESIQKRIESSSEISLYDFFNQEVFEGALQQLLKDENLIWENKGPANIQNYEILDMESASDSVGKLKDLFLSKEMFKLLHDYTDLDLAGPMAKEPKCFLEIQRWSLGNYTLLGDGALCEENTLDLVFYLNATEGVGVITYLSPEEEQQTQNYASYNVENDDDDSSLLLTITPVDNSLNLAYRCEGTTKFTKYISRNTPLEKGPVFTFSCSYKE